MRTAISPRLATSTFFSCVICQIMLTDTSKKYLITGCTDAKRSSQYNMELSQKRADAVVNVGIPIDEDPAWDYQNRYKTQEAGVDHMFYIKTGETKFV